jgi:DUF4097 and DUF4098 domain-containing protein YvlB
MLYKRTLTRELTVRTPFVLDLISANGPLKVTAGTTDLASVQATAEIAADSEAYADEILERIANGIVLSEGSLDIHYQGAHGERDDERVEVAYVIEVPVATRARIELANGPVEVRGIDGPLDVEHANGPLRISGVGGAVAVHTINGGLQAEGCGAEVEVTAVNGPLTLRDVADRVEIDTTNGPIQLQRIGGGIQAHALNGPISYEGDLGGDLDLSAHNGGISLRLPAASRFELDAASARGVVDSEFTVTGQEGAPADVYYVKLRTENGPIRLQKLQPAAVVG